MRMSCRYWTVLSVNKRKYCLEQSVVMMLLAMMMAQYYRKRYWFRDDDEKRRTSSIVERMYLKENIVDEKLVQDDFESMYREAEVEGDDDVDADVLTMVSEMIVRMRGVAHEIDVKHWNLQAIENDCEVLMNEIRCDEKMDLKGCANDSESVKVSVNDEKVDEEFENCREKNVRNEVQAEKTNDRSSGEERDACSKNCCFDFLLNY